MNDRRALVIALLVVLALPVWAFAMMGGSGGGDGGGMMGGMGAGMMGRWRSSGTVTYGPPIADAQGITIEAGDLWFQPTSIEVRSGTAVNLTLTNKGKVFHDVMIDALAFRLPADPGATVTGGLRLGAPGQYRFYCSVPGHADAGMRGTITVTAPQ